MRRVERFGPLMIDGEARIVALDGVDVALTKSEFALLSALASSPRVARETRELLESMWDSAWESDTTTLQVHVSRLRRKLGESGRRPRYIVTVHGFGYRFEPDPDGLAETGDGHRTGQGIQEVVLTVDRNLILTEVLPSVKVLGWELHEIVCTIFSPTGLDSAAVRSVIMVLLGTGAREVDGQIHALNKDGSISIIYARNQLILDDDGAFDGITVTLHLPRI